MVKIALPTQHLERISAVSRWFSSIERRSAEKLFMEKRFLFLSKPSRNKISAHGVRMCMTLHYIISKAQT
jgi:hypothetical protein